MRSPLAEFTDEELRAELARRDRFIRRDYGVGERPETDGIDHFIAVAGVRFSCPDCGVRIFQNLVNDTTRFVCNGCNSVWKGES
jgi:ribosomal protein L44E